MSNKHVFNITNNVVVDRGYYCFKYSPEIFEDYCKKRDVKSSFTCLFDQPLKILKNKQNFVPLIYENVLTTLFFETGFKKAQVLDISFNHLKYTKYSKEKSDLSITSLKIPIEYFDLLDNLFRLNPNKLDFVNTAMNFQYSETNVDTGYPELNSSLLLTYASIAKKAIDNLSPLIILTDLKLGSALKNFALNLYSNFPFTQDILIFNKTDVYLKSHKLIDESLDRNLVGYVKIPFQKNKDINGLVEFASRLGHEETREEYVVPNEIKAYDRKEDEKIKVYDLRKKLLFEGEKHDFIIINSHDN